MPCSKEPVTDIVKLQAKGVSSHKQQPLTAGKNQILRKQDRRSFHIHVGNLQQDNSFIQKLSFTESVDEESPVCAQTRRHKNESTLKNVLELVRDSGSDCSPAGSHDT